MAYLILKQIKTNERGVSWFVLEVTFILNIFLRRDVFIEMIEYPSKRERRCYVKNLNIKDQILRVLFGRCRQVGGHHLPNTIYSGSQIFPDRRSNNLARTILSHGDIDS